MEGSMKTHPALVIKVFLVIASFVSMEVYMGGVNGTEASGKLLFKSICF